MKAVLMSIKPQWCELIASGKKTVEVRKTKPKLEVPFKVYIYCSKDEPMYRSGEKFICPNKDFGNGNVIGEFVCDMIGKTSWTKSPANPLWVDGYDEESCLTNRELYEYSKGGTFYEWHISNLVIYDEPRELGEFKTVKEIGGYEELKPITRPFQSWGYVYEAD